MIKDGPIPLFLHGVIEYAAGVLFVLAPFLFGFDADLPTAISIVVGVGVLLVAIATDYPAGVLGSLPLSLHILIDYALGVFLVAAPFIFRFTDEGGPFAFFVILGVLHLVISTLTRFGVGRR